MDSPQNPTLTGAPDRTRLWQVAPDSVAATMSGGKRSSGFMTATLNLFWLSWVVAAPWFVPLSPAAIAFTYGSIVVFLPVYWFAWFGPMRWLPICLACMAVLGLISLPINTCWSYMIYATAMLPFAYRPRQALPRLAVLLVALAVVAWFSPHFNAPTVAFAVAMCLVISLLNMQMRVNALHNAELQLSHDEVRRLAALAERERIGRDLHDLLGSTLSLIAIKSQLAGRLMPRDGERAAKEVAEIEEVARTALGQVRNAVTGMRATVLASELASARLLLEAGGVQLRSELAPLPAPLSAEAESALALGLREAVTNAQRHARASLVQVRLQADADHVVLTVKDDGQGGVARHGNGLTGMAERLRSLGGGLTVESLKPGSGAAHGTVLSLRLPLSLPATPAVVVS